MPLIPTVVASKPVHLLQPRPPQACAAPSAVVLAAGCDTNRCAFTDVRGPRVCVQLEHLRVLPRAAADPLPAPCLATGALL